MNKPRLVLADRIIEGVAAGGAPLIHSASAILIEDGKVKAIGPAPAMKSEYPDIETLGGPGKVVMPGLINAHHHVGLTPFQLGSPDYPLELWFASRMALRDVDLRLDTLFSAFEMIASGVTTVQHLHSRAPGDTEAVLGAAQKVIGAYREIGMRACYSIALRDQNRLVYQDDQLFTESVPEELRPALRRFFERFTLPLKEQVAVFEALHAELADDARIRLQIAPSNLHWLSNEALELANELSVRYRLPLHMHILETPYQKEYARRRTGGSAVDYLERFGLLDNRLTIGHGVWMSDADIAQCAEHDVKICHNCSSNFRLKSGIAPVNKFLSKGIPVCLGIDEAGINDDRDMLQEMRLVLRAHREPGIDAPQPSAADVFRMATEYGAATTPFGNLIGSLRPGAEADLVILDYHKITHPYQHEDTPLIDVILFRAKSSAVETVMVSGDIIYDRGIFTHINRDQVLSVIQESLASPLTLAEQGRRELSESIFPHVKAFYDRWLPEELGMPHTFYNACL